MSKIKTYSQYGSVRSQAIRGSIHEYNMNLPASSDDPHGLTRGQVQQMQNRFESFLPKLAGANTVSRDFIRDVMPDEATIMPTPPGSGWSSMGFNRRQAVGFGSDLSALPSGSGSGQALVTQQRPYQPEFESPDRQQYPIHRILANRYWRLFYKLDPVIGNCIEMYGDMPWSDFELTGEGVDGSVKHQFQHMCDITKFRSILPFIAKELFVTGEAIPHLHYSDDEGIWTYIALHNPDQLEIIHAPFIDMEPIIQFVPDDRLRQVLLSDHYLTKKLRDSIPDHLISRLLARQNIELSPINATLIARKLHPYDTRGTSIISRMWRILMYEDAIFNASIATARRHAGPIKIAKLGNPQTGWIPDESHERRLMELVAQAELDVNAWIVYHYGVQFELVGTTDRVMTIDRHWDTIERVKLVAMGLSKAFLHGEVTYACFSEDSPVSYPDGSTKPIQDVQIGDKVLDKDGKIQTVETAWCEGTPDEVTEIDLWGIKDKIVVTNNHKWPVWAWPRTCACGCGENVRPGKCFVQHHHEQTGGRYNKIKLIKVDGEQEKPRQIPENYEPVQKLRSDELRKGDFLMIPRKFDPIKTDVTPELARLLGYHVAEGDFLKTRNEIVGIRFSFSGEEYHTWGKDVVGLLEKSGFKNSRRYKYKSRNASKATSQYRGDTERYHWFKSNAGEYATSKSLSEEVMRWPVKLKRELIIGAFRGDGSQVLHNVTNRHSLGYKEFCVCYTTTSSMLAEQMRMILAQLGFFACVKEQKERTGKDGSHRQKNYILFVYGNHARDLSKLVWNDKSVAPNLKNKIRDRFRVDDDYIYVPIRRIRQVKNIKKVYNLTISGSHSYLAHGIGTYNSAAAGLSVFLQRLKALREFIEDTWIYPKFFRQISIMNGWIKPTEAELSHKVRIRRSYRELIDDNRYIVPKIRWQRELDPAVNQEMLNAVQALQGMGVNVSDTTKFASAGMDFETELMQGIQDAKLKAKLKTQYPEIAQMLAPAPEPGAGGGMPGGGELPTAPGEAFEGFEPSEGGGVPIETLETAPLQEGASVEAGDDGEEHSYSTRSTLRSQLWNDDKYGNWHADDIVPLIELLETGDTGDEYWRDLADNEAFKKELNQFGAEGTWGYIEDFLIDANFPNGDIIDLRYILEKEGILLDGTKELKAEINKIVKEDSALNQRQSKALFMGIGSAEEQRDARRNFDNVRLGNKIGTRAAIMLQDLQKKRSASNRSQEHRLFSKRRFGSNPV